MRDKITRKAAEWIKAPAKVPFGHGVDFQAWRFMKMLKSITEKIHLNYLHLLSVKASLPIMEELSFPGTCTIHLQLINTLDHPLL